MKFLSNHRIPELLFQPSMIGLEQAGVAETIQFVLNKYPPDIQNKLCQVSPKLLLHTCNQIYSLSGIFNLLIILNVYVCVYVSD